MQTPAFEIFEMLARGQLTSQAIYIVAKLRIADYLHVLPQLHSKTMPILLGRIESNKAIVTIDSTRMTYNFRSKISKYVPS
jgi:hypothetical protein